MSGLERFMEYFRANYPGPNTIIAKPDWHSPKIYAAALSASGHGDLLAACKAMVDDFEIVARSSYTRTATDEFVESDVEEADARGYAAWMLARAAIEKAEQ